MKNSVENVENQILSILEEVGAKMAPTIERFLFEGQVKRCHREKKEYDPLLEDSCVYLAGLSVR